MDRKTKLFVLVFSLICVLATATRGTSYYFPKFGAPVVTESNLVFAGPGMSSHRIICIRKDGGKKVWEIEDAKEVIQPWFIIGNDLVITKGDNIFLCNLQNGDAQMIYETGYERCSLNPDDLPVIVIRGTKQKAGYLSLVDSQGKKPIWEIVNVEGVVAKGTNILLCQYSERKFVSGGSYTLVDQKLKAIAKKSGETLWQFDQSKDSFSVKGMAVGSNFVVCDAGIVYCLDQKTGSVVKKRKIQDSPFASASLSLRNGSVLVWTQEGKDLSSGHVMYSLSVPELERSEVAKADWYAAVSEIYDDIVIGTTVGRVDTYNLKTGEKIWQGGQWNWRGIHDGLIYYSTMDINGQSTSINKIDVKSGKVSLLYREPLPEEMRRK